MGACPIGRANCGHVRLHRGSTPVQVGDGRGHGDGAGEVGGERIRSTCNGHLASGGLAEVHVLAGGGQAHVVEEAVTQYQHRRCQVAIHATDGRGLHAGWDDDESRVLWIGKAVAFSGQAHVDLDVLLQDLVQGGVVGSQVNIVDQYRSARQKIGQGWRDGLRG